jgi:hypothetical protein
MKLAFLISWDRKNIIIIKIKKEKTAQAFTMSQERRHYRLK